MRAGCQHDGRLSKTSTYVRRKSPHRVNSTRGDGDRDDADRCAADVEGCSCDLASLRLGDGHESVGLVELFVVLEVRAQIVENHGLRRHKKKRFEGPRRHRSGRPRREKGQRRRGY